MSTLVYGELVLLSLHWGDSKMFDMKKRRRFVLEYLNMFLKKLIFS
jgi:hypothetical protein